MKKDEVKVGKRDTTPLCEKLCLTVSEASQYSGIGINKISELLNDPSCPFVMRVGRKRMVKREAFEEFIKSADQI